MKTTVIEVVLIATIAGLLAWKIRHLYTSFGCDGWGEYRRVGGR